MARGLSHIRVARLPLCAALLVVSVLHEPATAGFDANSAVRPLEMVVRDRVEVGGQPFKVFFSEVDSQESLLVLNARGYVSKVDLDTRKVIAKSGQLRTGIMDAVVSPDGTRMLTWYTGGSKLFVLDTTTLDVLARVKCGKNLGRGLFTADGTLALISAVHSRRVCIVDLQSFDVIRRIPFPKAIGHISLHPNGTIASASAGIFSYGSKRSAPRGSHIFLFDPRPEHNPSVLEAGSLVSGRHPRGSMFTAEGKWLVTANRLSGDLSITHVERGMVTEVATSGRGVEAIVALNDAGRFAGVNRHDTHISVYQAQTQGVTFEGNIYLSGAPYQLAPFASAPFALATILGSTIQIPATDWFQGNAYKVTYIKGQPVKHAKYTHGLALIDLRTMREVDFIKVGKGPMDVAIHPKGHMAAVACARQRSVDLVF